MAFSLKWNPDSLDRLPKEVIPRIIRKIESILVDPFHYLEHYEGEKVYKLRIGDYRALIDVDFSQQILIVRVVDHRGRVYKRGF